MVQPLTVRVLGVRGSTPAPSREYLTYGGNTTSFALEWGEARLLLDAGTGLTGYHVHGRCLLLLSHLHLDHVEGLIRWPALLDPGVDCTVYGPAGLAGHLDGLFSAPYWPVGLSDLAAAVRIRDLAPGEAFSPVPGVTVRTMAGGHLGSCLYYRVEAGGASVVYALDCECGEDLRPRLTEFARGADLLIWDATFAPEDLRPGWGHSTWKQGAALARDAGVERVLMAHYSHDCTDERLARLEAEAGESCIFAREGMTLCLSPRAI